MKEADAPRWFVGIDWAQDSHDVCRVSLSGEVMNELKVAHDPGSLREFCRWLSDEAEGQNSAAYVAIEVPHGPVVETLLERGFTVFSINPKQLDRFRDRFSVAGAKDDRLDARVLADSLRTDRHCFRQLQPESPKTIEIREWSRMHDELKHDVNRLSNQMREHLRRYYLQFCQLGDVTERWVLDIWEKAPTPEKARHLKRATVEKLLKKRRIRRFSSDDVLQTLRQPPLTVAEGTAEAASAHIRLLVPRLRLAIEQRDQCERRLKRLLESAADEVSEEERNEQRDVAIMLSFPGLGIINTAVLLAEASQALRERDYHALRALSGQAPVTRRSGKRLRVVHMRQACNPRLQNALYHWARVASQTDGYCKAQYTVLRARGCGHARALRTVGDRLLKALCAALRSGQLYDSALRRGARLAA